MSWQSVWRSEAASMMQRAYRVFRMRRAWHAMIRHVRSYNRYVMGHNRAHIAMSYDRYVMRYSYVMREYQSRGQMHVHVPISRLSLTEAVWMEEVD